MATLPRGISLVLDTLRTIAQRFGDGQTWTTQELWDALLADLPPEGRAQRLSRGWAVLPDRIEARGPEALDELLPSLQALGLVASADRDGEHALTGFTRWRAGERWHPPRPPEGGGGDRGPGEPGAPGDGDGGGGGIREVLAHPVLFALPEADFDALLEGLSDGVQA